MNEKQESKMALSHLVFLTSGSRDLYIHFIIDASSGEIIMTSLPLQLNSFIFWVMSTPYRCFCCSNHIVLYFFRSLSGEIDKNKLKESSY